MIDFGAFIWENIEGDVAVLISGRGAEDTVELEELQHKGRSISYSISLG